MGQSGSSTISIHFNKLKASKNLFLLLSCSLNLATNLVSKHRDIHQGIIASKGCILTAFKSHNVGTQSISRKHSFTSTLQDRIGNLACSPTATAIEIKHMGTQHAVNQKLIRIKHILSSFHIKKLKKK